MICTRCDGTGFLNLDQVPKSILAQAEGAAEASGDKWEFVDYILEWIANNEEHYVLVCDCCGDGTDWYDRTPGEHTEADFGKDGPYAYNGGLPECY